MFKKIFVIGCLSLLCSCTENVRARQYGGTMTVNVPCGKKVFNTTFKNADFWYSVRPMKEGEEPETVEFIEDSNFGILNGKIILRERKCN
jgi:hypothetical protein